MTKLTEKQLIETLRCLKEIKPREDWAGLLKAQILAEKKEAVVAEKIGIMEVLSNVFLQRKMAYSFATLAFLIIGLIGFAETTVPGDLLFPVKKLAEQSQAALLGQTGIQKSVAVLNNRINELAQATKDGKSESVSSAITEISANAKDLAEGLKNNTIDDKNAIQQIADSLKVLADTGADLSNDQDVMDLYQIVAANQIEDLQNTTLTDEQKLILAEAESLYEEGKYADSLEKILTINN